MEYRYFIEIEILISIHPQYTYCDSSILGQFRFYPQPEIGRVRQVFVVCFFSSNYLIFLLLTAYVSF